MRVFQLTRNQLVAVILIAIVASSPLFFVAGLAATPTTPQTIGGGNIAGAPSYTVYEDGGNYFAKNALGQNVYSGTNVSYIFNTIISNGVSIYVSSGSYVITETIWLDDNVKLTGSGIETTVFIQTADLGGCIRGGSAYYSIAGVENVTLSDFSIMGYQGGSNSNNGIAFEESENIKITNVDVYHVQQNAFRFSDSTHVFLSNLYAEDVSTSQAYSFDGIFDSTFNNLNAVNCGSYALDLSYARNVAVSDCIFEGEATSIKVDLGNVGEYSSGVTLTNIVVKNFGTTLNGLIVQDTYNSTFSNLIFLNGYRALRLERVNLCTFTNIVISNMTSNAGYLAQDIDRVTLSNIISESTTSTALSIGTTTKVNVIGCTFKNGLIIDAGTDTHITATWNSTVWIDAY